MLLESSLMRITSYSIEFYEELTIVWAILILKEV